MANGTQTQNNDSDSRPNMNPPRHRRHHHNNGGGGGIEIRFYGKGNSSRPAHPVPNSGVGEHSNSHVCSTHRGLHPISVSQGGGGASSSAAASNALMSSSTQDAPSSGRGPLGLSTGRLRRERTRMAANPSPPPLPPLPSPYRSENIPGATTTTSQVGNSLLNPELLPDILHSHLPPPYSTLPHHTSDPHSRHCDVPAVPVSPVLAAAAPTCSAAAAASSAGPVPCGVLPLPPALPPPPPPFPPSRRSWGDRFRSPAGPSGRRGHSRSTLWGSHYTPEDEPKHCCGVAVTQTVSIRWFIVMIAFVGLCCAIVGTVLGALKATGREHLTVSLLMIGVGIVLITVSAIAWRLTSHDAPSCRMMLGLPSAEPEPNRRFVPRVPPSYGRPHHPYAAMMYPEFQYRPPPPSYQASMQEYRLRLLLLDRHHPSTSTSLSPVSPPPTYRSNLDTSTFTSRPPSYRSQASSVNLCPNNDNNTVQNGTLCGSQTTTTRGGTLRSTHTHSRDPSLSLSLLSHESLFDVVVAAPSSTEQQQHSNNNNNNCGPKSPPPPSSTTKTTTTTVIVSTPLTVPPPSSSTSSSSNSSSSASATVNSSSAAGRRTLGRRPDVHATIDEGGPLEHHEPPERKKECHPVVAARQTVASKMKRPPCDCNVVTIVQTHNSSQVVASGGNISSCSEGTGSSSGGGGGGGHLAQQQQQQQRASSHGEMEVLAHL